MLEKRAEIRCEIQNAALVGMRLAARQRAAAKPKVIALYRTDRGRFALDEDGSWQPSIKTTLVIPKRRRPVGRLPLRAAQLGAARPLVRGAGQDAVGRMAQLRAEADGRDPLPARRPAGQGRSETAEAPWRGAEVKVTQGPSVEIAAEIEGGLRKSKDDGLAADAPEAVEGAKAEAIVRAIADNRRALLPLRKRFPALSRVVKDPWSTEPVGPEVAEFVAALPKKKRASVRVDPESRVARSIPTGTLGKVTARRRSLGVQLSAPVRSHRSMDRPRS